MKYFAIYALLLVAVVAKNVDAEAKDTCSADANKACTSKIDKDMLLKNCNALYGGMGHVTVYENGTEVMELVVDMQHYANLHLKRSFEHLLVSTHFANYINNRPGFEKLFRELSDEAWEDGIELIKHIGKRDAIHNFEAAVEDKLNPDKKTDIYEQYELQAMSRAVDVQKNLAAEAFKIHETALRRHKNVHDPEIAHFIEEKFAGKHAEQIKTLVGHVVDLREFTKSADTSLAIHLFDEYLMKA
jgi:hypothetical protein